MDWKTLYATLDGLFDRDACMQVLREIWGNDRWFSFEKFEQTAHWCAEYLRDAGLSQIELLPLKADGKTKYYDWKIPRAWQAKSAKLCYADGEVIADYAQKPCSLAMRSPATPVGGVEGEVVIPDKDDPDPEKYRGKVLLVSEAEGTWTAFANQCGALGILSDFIPLSAARPGRESLYDDVSWRGIAGAPGNGVFGFHLTARQADRMRAQLQEGPVWVKAEVDSHSYEGEVYTVSAALEGTNPDAPEILLYGHLYEPGANDNASGAGAILYLARVLAGAVANGQLPRPERTIRFVMGYECGGSMGYMAAHADRPVLCGIVADMIGAEALENAVMGLRYDPLSNWSFADGALYALSRIAREHTGKEIPYQHLSFSIGTDNILADPAFRCPTVAMVAVPALSYHSSHDTPEQVEPDTLKRNGLIVGTYAWGFATADEETCSFLSGAIRDRMQADMGPDTHPRRKKLMEQAVDRAVSSMERICPEREGAVPEFYTEPAPAYVTDVHLRVPRRLVEGALTFRGEHNGKSFVASWSGEMNIPLFWIDGKRTLWQIAYLSAVEKGKCTDEQIREELELLTDYFDCLTEYGYLAWN